MNAQVHTLSLSRWHKVAERLSRVHADCVATARRIFNETRVPANLGETQRDLLRRQAQLAMSKLETAARVQDSIVRIRIALGEENAKRGIPERLARLDVLQRRHRLWTEILAAQDSMMVQIDTLGEVPKDYVADGERYDSRRPHLRVGMMDEGMQAELSARAEEARVSSYALGDEIADLNRGQLALELEPDVAHEAGL